MRNPAGSHTFLTVDGGVKVMRLFQKKQSMGGEVAILRLSSAKYKTFIDDPLTFVNKTFGGKIFLFPLKGISQKGSPISGMVAKEVVVVLSHDVGCFAEFIANVKG